MSRRLIHAFVLLVSALPVTIVGQELPADSSDRKEPVGVASPFPEATPAFASELERKNYLDLGLSTEMLFDDNALSAPSGMQSDLSYVVAPNIGLRQSRGRFDWRLKYKGGFAIHQKFDSYNQGAHDFDGELSYKLSSHVDVGIANRFLKTTGLFNQVQLQTSQPGTLLQQPSQSVVVPIADQNSNLALVTVNDQFSEKSAIGGGVTFYTLRFGQKTAGSLLYDTDSQEAETYYNHRISTTNLFGLTYRFQRYTFGGVTDGTTVHSLLGTYEIAARKYATLTFFAGPEYISSAVLSGTVRQTTVMAAGGASLAINGERLGFTASVSRMINDGGGLLRTVNLTRAGGTLRLRWSESWSTELGGAYAINDPIGTAAPFSEVKDLAGSIGVTRRLAMWNLGFGYTRILQIQDAAANKTSNVQHNGAWASVAYVFSRPIGRD